MASATWVPATKRLERRWPIADFSATDRKERLSEREMKSALSTDGRPRDRYYCESPLRRACGSQEVVPQTGRRNGVTAITLSGLRHHDHGASCMCSRRGRRDFLFHR